MKVRDSGMPNETQWRSYYDPESALNSLMSNISGDTLEFGCGYSTFTFAAARRLRGTLTALDIEPDLVERVVHRAKELGIHNVRVIQRDFIADGCGLSDLSQDHAMIYNLLHLKNPIALLTEARRVLQPEGSLSVIHWRSDIPTPRGPALAIRPTPTQCERWLRSAGFAHIQRIDLEQSCPYHFGLLATLKEHIHEVPDRPQSPTLRRN